MFAENITFENVIMCLKYIIKYNNVKNLPTNNIFKLPTTK